MSRYVFNRPHVADEKDYQMEDIERQAFSVREFCARYGIARQTFYDEVGRGRLLAHKIGKRNLILKTDAERWAASLPALKVRAASNGAV
jgi:excisionase family DNA binding protein